MNVLFTLLLMLPSAEGRPAWVDAQPGLRDGTYETQTIVGPESSRELCEKQVLPAVRAAFEEYRTRWNESNGYGPTPFVALEYNDGELLKRIIGEKWEEHVKVEGADRIFLHVQLKFDARLQGEWRRAADYGVSERRSVTLTIAFLLAMWTVAVVHVGLHLDGMVAERRTKGIVWATACVLVALPLLIIG